MWYGAVEFVCLAAGGLSTPRHSQTEFEGEEAWNSSESEESQKASIIEIQVDKINEQKITDHRRNRTKTIMFSNRIGPLQGYRLL